MISLGGMVKIWKKVFGDVKYVLLVFGVAILFYLFNVFVANWRTFTTFWESNGFWRALKFILGLSIEFRKTIEFHSFISLIIICILFGVLVSLLTYRFKSRYKNQSKKLGIVGGIGVFLGILAPGCSACGIGLVSVFGIGAGFFSALPYKGLEISVLAILIILFSIIKVSENLKEGISCKIDVKN